MLPCGRKALDSEDLGRSGTEVREWHRIRAGEIRIALASANLIRYSALMAKKKARLAPATTETTKTKSTTAAVTAEDLAMARQLPPSNRSLPINSFSMTLAKFYATPSVRETLLELQPALALFKGCADLATALDAAQQSVTLAPLANALRELADGCAQQIIENNKVITPVDTALAAAAKGAAVGTPAQKGLAGFAKLRRSKITRTKAVKTKNKNAKKKPTDPDKTK